MRSGDLKFFSSTEDSDVESSARRWVVLLSLAMGYFVLVFL